MKTAVVILNWNTKGYLQQFLPGLIASTEGMDAEVIVADSASTDGSLEMLYHEFPTVRQIRLDRNYGFTGGYNRALAQVEADYYVLINSDIEVPQDWLKPLVAWMDSHPKCGACGPKLLSWHDRTRFEYAGAAGGLLDRYGYPFCRGRVMKKVERDEGQYDTPADVFWVSGACLMVRSRLWKKLGGLDDRFFAHMEEIDLCWRLQLAGYRVTVVPASYVYHIGGGTLPNDSPAKLRFNYRNNLLLLENNLAKTFRTCCWRTTSPRPSGRKGTAWKAPWARPGGASSPGCSWTGPPPSPTWSPRNGTPTRPWSRPMPNTGNCAASRTPTRWLPSRKKSPSMAGIPGGWCPGP